MSQSAQQSPQTSKKGAAQKPITAPESEAASAPEKGDVLVALWLRYARFGWDIVGVTLLAAALLTMIGVVSRGQAWAQGFLLSRWVGVVSMGFGWGWPLLAAALALLGLLALRRRYAAGWPRIHLTHVLAVEGAGFALLMLFSIFGGISLTNAQAGRDGGIIGWGLAALLDEVLPIPFSTVFIFALLLFLLAYGTGLLHWAHALLVKWLDEVNPGGATMPAVSTVTPDISSMQTGEVGVPAVSVAIPQRILQRGVDLPPLSLLLEDQALKPDEEQIQMTAALIEHTLAEFGIPTTVVGYRVGPTVTQFALEPGFVEKPNPEGEMTRQKVRVSQISALARDLALALAVERLRIEAPVPGQAFVGVEVPNARISIVHMRSLLESEAFNKMSAPLAVALGRDVSGEPLIADLARMPHLLIAGATGSGKSICIMTLTTCLVMNNTPETLRLAMLDPKMVELARFNGLPHLFGKVETEHARMLGVLQWTLNEMDRRYRTLEEAHVRDIDAFNQRAARKGEKPMPRLVVMVDELADLMMTAPEQTEHSLIRLAQMARATGIHLVVATQRPSTDVVTGLIKANFPARLAFMVSSSIDSRVILDTNGAETLIGKGDMLFLNPEAGTPQRAQGAWISDTEIDAIIAFWKEKAQASGVAAEEAPWEGLVTAGISADEDDSDKLVEQATQIIRQTQRASASLLQRRLRIGYPRAARLIDELENLGVVGPSQSGGKERDVLLPPTGEGGDVNDFDE